MSDKTTYYRKNRNVILNRPKEILYYEYNKEINIMKITKKD